MALEGALKLKEISYIHAEGYAAGEMKHGPIALIHEAMPVVVLYSAQELPEKVLSNMQEVRARRGILLVLADHVNPEVEELADHLLRLPLAPGSSCPSPSPRPCSFSPTTWPGSRGPTWISPGISRRR